MGEYVNSTGSRSIGFHSEIYITDIIIDKRYKRVTVMLVIEALNKVRQRRVMKR